MVDAPLVLDASALLAGKRWSASARLVVPAPVLDEVSKRGRDARALSYLVEAGLDVREPSPEGLARARAAAARTGDARRLSDVDVAVLAVALDVAGRVATDDYSIQNVASVLGVPFEGVDKRGIREVFSWRLRCAGCRKWFDRDVPECDVCGSPVRSSRAPR